MGRPKIGIYERLLDKELESLVRRDSSLLASFRSINEEAEPHAFAQYFGQLLKRALRVAQKEERINILNRLIDLLSSANGLDFLAQKQLIQDPKNLLTQIVNSNVVLPRPETPLSTSTLITGQGADAPLEHELRAEMMTADRVDILVSFIKWSGLRLLRPAFEHLNANDVPVRVLSTSYMGASDPPALEWLAKQRNIEVRISFDTGGTRLHAKAYHFVRDSDYSTAYIGSANMSHSAMTQGLEWTVKATHQDMPQVLDRFIAEFESYWESDDFEPFDENNFGRFRKAITNFRKQSHSGARFFAEITPRPFQLRILEALAAARQSGSNRNLVVAATGTGKTVVSALDYQRYTKDAGRKLNLLFVAHRKEILQQSLECYRTVLRDQNFGELLVDGEVPTQWNHVFASIQSLNRNEPWRRLGETHFQFVVVDEAHHGAASSYRPLFEHLQPTILVGLTATPERMDGSSILPDFDGNYAAEIRLAEALEEKLLCPFHYFGVTDNINLEDDKFWRNGKYDVSALENVFTGDDIRAKQRVDNILAALDRYQPDLEGVRGVGFCAGVKHAQYMARCFNECGIKSAVVVGGTPRDRRDENIQAFREGKLTFLFTVDVLSEGVDVPEINLVLFLRPTESLTVFLQQLGRGLRHAPDKECLTVLDFVGQTHRKYRLDTKYSALLSRRRQRIDRELENDFPHLPPGCSIQLERVARDTVLRKIRSVLDDLKQFIPETIRTWGSQVDKPLTFGNFVEETGLSAVDILAKRTWSEWKSAARSEPPPSDPDLSIGRAALARIALRTDPTLLANVASIGSNQELATTQGTALHYLLWGKKAEAVGICSIEESLAKWQRNRSLVSDSLEIAEWRSTKPQFPITNIRLPFDTSLKLHAAYGSFDIKSALGLATIEKPGPTGQGVIHIERLKTYVHLVTFRKEDKDFSPTTRYQDYPISRTHLHWESQSRTTQDSPTGQNYINFKERGYTILFFARLERTVDGATAPFIFLGPTKQLLSYKGERPISMVWELEHPIPAALFEEARAA